MKHLNLAEQKGLVNIIALSIIALVAISLPLTTKLVQKNQENRSHAASNDSACTSIGGKCLDRNTKVCTGNKQWYKGKCPGASNIQCCAPKETTTTATTSIKQDSKCTSAGGTCKKVSDGCSGGSFLAGYCPSSESNVKCCVLTITSGSIPQDSKCSNIGGTCQDGKLICSNGKEYKTGYCPSSGSDIKCCAPKFSEYSSNIVQSETCKKDYDGDGVCMLIKDWEKVSLDMRGYNSSSDATKSCSEVNNNPNVICTAPQRDKCKAGSTKCDTDKYLLTCEKDSTGYFKMGYGDNYDCKSQGKKCKDGKCLPGCKCIPLENESDYYKSDVTEKARCQTGTPKDIHSSTDKTGELYYLWTCGDSSSCVDTTCGKYHPQGIFYYD